MAGPASGTFCRMLTWGPVMASWAGVRSRSVGDLLCCSSRLYDTWIGRQQVSQSVMASVGVGAQAQARTRKRFRRRGPSHGLTSTWHVRIHSIPGD